MKKQVTILILTIAVATAVSGCIKKTDKPVVKDDDQQKIATTADQKIDQKKAYEGELIKEKDGWKKYRNEYWGIEFRFRDEGDEIDKNDMRDGMELIYNKKGRIYIFFYKNSFKFDQKQQANLKEYLKAGGWNNYTNRAELISLKEVKNNNNLTFIEVITNVSGGRQSPGFHKDKIYYIECNKKIKNKNVIKIDYSNFNLSQDIIDNFKFID